MTTQEYLSQYLDAKREERRLERLIQRTRDRLAILGLDTTKDKVQSSVTDDRTARIVAELVDFRNELEAQQLKSVQAQRAIERTIELLPDAKQREVLSLRYIEGMPWNAVRKELNYGFSWLFNTHRRGLDTAKKILHNKSVE